LGHPANAARQHERGLVKTEKEAEVFLIERRLDHRVNLLAAKRYRSFEDRMLRNDSRYRQGRRTGKPGGQGHGAGQPGRDGVSRSPMGRDRVRDARPTLDGRRIGTVSGTRLGRETMIEYIGSEETAAPRLVRFEDQSHNSGTFTGSCSTT
jgi:hypothetical protein